MLLRRAMSALSEGDLNQIVNVLRIEKRRSDLFGLDSPKQLEVAGADGGPLQTDVGEMLRLRLEEIREKSPEPLEIETETSG